MKYTLFLNLTTNFSSLYRLANLNQVVKKNFHEWIPFTFDQLHHHKLSR